MRRSDRRRIGGDGAPLHRRPGPQRPPALAVNVRKAIAWTMFLGGIAGAVLSLLGVIANGEPQWVLQLSWAALWSTGFVMVLVVDSEQRQSRDLHAKLDALLVSHGHDPGDFGG